MSKNFSALLDLIAKYEFTVPLDRLQNKPAFDEKVIIGVELVAQLNGITDQLGLIHADLVEANKVYRHSIDRADERIQTSGDAIMRMVSALDPLIQMIGPLAGFPGLDKSAEKPKLDLKWYRLMDYSGDQPMQIRREMASQETIEDLNMNEDLVENNQAWELDPDQSEPAPAVDK